MSKTIRATPILVFLAIIGLVYGSAKFSGCDFDLVEKHPDLIEYLSDECKEFSKNKESEEYKILLRESLAFADFQSKLNEYERRKDPRTVHRIRMEAESHKNSGNSEMKSTAKVISSSTSSLARTSKK